MSLAFFMSVSGSGQSGGTPPNNPANTTLDGKQVFLNMGQSNMQGGVGDSTQSEVVPTGQGFQYDQRNDQLIHLQDPVIWLGSRLNAPALNVDAQTGSLHPAFAKRYNQISGKKAVIVPAGYGGAGLNFNQTNPYFVAPEGSGRWIFNTNVADCDQCLTLLGLTEPRGIIWLQGETGAQELAINHSYDIGTIPLPDGSGNFTWDANDLMNFETYALTKLIDDFKIKYPNTPFYFIQTGIRNESTPTGRVDYPTIDDCYVAIYTMQQAQVDFWNSSVWDSLPAKKGNVYTANTEFKTFHGLGLMADPNHANQAGLNRLGSVTAEFVNLNPGKAM